MPEQPEKSAGDSSSGASGVQGGVAAPAKRRRGRGRWLAVAGLLVLIGLAGAEVVGRVVLRLGDPPLYVADPDVEYMMKPGGRYERFYAVSTYNRWSMRATPEIEKAKTDPREFRVLVMGDSVVNGGPQTDDKQLATVLVKDRVASAASGRPVVVGNVSCGSWGPPNLLAYAKKFGLFGADVVVVVLNHEDAYDVPTFAPLGKEMPTRKPVLALEEAVFRYIPSWLETKFGSAGGAPPASVTITPERAAAMETCDKALRELIGLARQNGCKVAAVLHSARSEAQGEALPGTLRLRGVLRDLGVPVRETTTAMQEALRRGVPAYRDNIHLNPEGQPMLADVLGEAIEAAR